jgi:hypothetical protein
MFCDSVGIVVIARRESDEAILLLVFLKTRLPRAPLGALAMTNF